MERIQVLSKHIPRLQDEWFESLQLAVHGRYRPIARVEEDETDYNLDEDYGGVFDPKFRNRVADLRQRSSIIAQRGRRRK